MSISSGTMSNLSSLGTQAVAEIGNLAATEITISAGKSQISVKNTGDALVWIGDEDVSPATKRGWPLYPTDGYEFKECRANFVLYGKCGAGETSELSIVEA